MRFLYNPHKSAQAAAYLVKRQGGRGNVMALIKLLYLADRKSLIETGRSITGDAMVSMPHGPVLSQILDAVNWGSSPFNEYLTERSDYEVALRNQHPEQDELSDYEVEVLDDIYSQYGHLGKYQLRDLTHTLPEWCDPNGSSKRIEPADILRLAGKSDDEIETIASEAEEFYLVGQILGKA